jgi:hypothetical protein
MQQSPYPFEYLHYIAKTADCNRGAGLFTDCLIFFCRQKPEENEKKSFSVEENGCTFGADAV